MRSRSSGTIVVLALLMLPGCGTFFNLKDPPNGPLFIGTGVCYPFGGVVRSGLLACMGPPMGPCGVVGGIGTLCQGDFGTGLELIGGGICMTCAGLAAIADTPLSLAGDMLTLPIVYARTHDYAWATWWGEQGRPNMPIPSPQDEKKEPDASTEQSDG
jgi:hypothetical protein